MYTLKKSLGQHFLKDESIINKIVDALSQNPFHQLLEVGPGGGALTKKLIQLPKIEFKAVELDQEKVDFLKKTYPDLQNKIIHASFLDIDTPFKDSFTVIGNFPYNISTQILFKILDWKDQVPVIIGMFQKEVAERAASPSGSKTYGVLSILMQAYYDVEYLFDVPPGSFNPPPKVMSGVIRLTRRSDTLNYRSEKDFHRLVKLAFQQRRKTLRNALRPLLPTDFSSVPYLDLRAEALSWEQFVTLGKAIIKARV
jgi:16S rRNA (adenine1518-N6/adenine1519-N6)-dimethyltransferase